MAKQNPKLNVCARERKEVIEKLGAKVVSWTLSSASHVKFILELPDRTTRLLVCPNSSSDIRGIKNMSSMVRRWMAEAQGTPATA